MATQPQGDNRQYGPQGKWNSPSPGVKIFAAKHILQNYHHQYSQQLTANQGDILEGRIEALTAFNRYLTHIGGTGTVLAADGQPLEQTRQQ